MRFSKYFLIKFAKTDSKSFMLAIYPDAATLQKIVDYQKSLKLKEVDELIPKKEFHCTLRYWKQSEYSDMENVISVLEKIKFPEKTIDCSKGELDIFGEDKALVIKISNPELTRFQAELDKELQGLGIPPSDFPEYRGHITLAYGVEEIPEKKPDFIVSLNEVKFVDNDDKSFWNRKF